MFCLLYNIATISKKKNVTCQVFHFSIYKFHPNTFCYQCFCYLGQFDCWCLLKIPGFMNILCVTKMLCNPFKLSIISNNWRTVAICFLIFIDVTKWGFLKLAYKHNSCTTSHPRIRFTERLVVQANKYYLLQLQPSILFLISISIASWTSSVNKVGTRFFRLHFEYITFKREASSLSHGSVILSISSERFHLSQLIK